MLLVGYIKQSLGLLLVGHILGLSIGVRSAEAQEVGTCAPAVGEAYLDVGNVRARILNNGGLFWRGSPSVYEVPKGSGNRSIFTAALWVGGLVEDSLRITAARFGNHEFWAGPLDASGNSPDDCSAYDRVASIYREDVEQYEQAGHMSDRLLGWPWEWGAPVVDGDGDSINYNLAGGDRPAFVGDQTVWWVMNDVGNVHRSTGSHPLGLQVHASAFAFNVPGAVGNTTFYRYQLHYKGQAPLDSAYIALYVDSDLGNFIDDAIAADTMLGMGYTYNLDGVDEGEYEEMPPALGVSFLQGPIALLDRHDNDRDGEVDEQDERLRATAVTFHYGGGNVHTDPVQGREYYNYMLARWRDGSPLTFGGDGYSFSSQSTAFAFPGDPVTHAFWSMMNMDEHGTVADRGDRKFIVSAGPFRMERGDVEEVVFAIVWSQGTDHLDSVRKLREDMAYIQSITPHLLVSHIPVSRETSTERSIRSYSHNYPNPFAEQTTIRYSLERPEHVTLEVYDMLGREVALLVDVKQDAGWHEAVFDARGLAAGTYVYRLQVGYVVATEMMSVVR